MSKPLNTYVRVPFRGTHYVEAAALDSAIAKIADLEKKLGLHPDDQAGALEVPEESALTTEADAAQEKALEELMHLVGGSLLDDETGPAQILDFVKRGEKFAVDQQVKIAERDLKIIDLEATLSTTKEMLTAAEKNFHDLCCWLNGTTITPCDARIPEVVKNTLGVAKDKVASLEEVVKIKDADIEQKAGFITSLQAELAKVGAAAEALRVADRDTDHTTKGGLPEVTGGNAEGGGESIKTESSGEQA